MTKENYILAYCGTGIGAFLGAITGPTFWGIDLGIPVKLVLAGIATLVAGTLIGWRWNIRDFIGHSKEKKPSP